MRIATGVAFISLVATNSAAQEHQVGKLRDTWTGCLKDIASDYAKRSKEPAEDIVKAALGRCESDLYKYIVSLQILTKSKGSVEETQRLFDNSQKEQINKLYSTVLDARIN
jgi:hypothetical protein